MLGTARGRRGVLCGPLLPLLACAYGVLARQLASAPPARGANKGRAKQPHHKDNNRQDRSLRASPIAASSAVVDKISKGSAKRRYYRQELRNVGDLLYVAQVKVGSQQMNVVPDTGSFEVVVFSEECKKCGLHSNLFHPSRSESYEKGNAMSLKQYGSGAATTREAYDQVAVGPFSVNRQLFWETVDATISVGVLIRTFQGVFGLGPPASAEKWAFKENRIMHSEVEEMRASGVDVSTDEPRVQQFLDIAKLVKKSPQWLTAAKVRTFSVCFGTLANSPGYLVWNDGVVDEHPNLFTKMKSIGDYWATDVSDAKVGLTNLGCQWHPCTAIFDTGTSLIAAPSSVVDKLTKHFLSWSNHQGTCDDLTKLPDLSFMLGGKRFTLPPQSYVGRISGDVPEWLESFMPYLPRLRQKRFGKEDMSELSEVNITTEYCAPLIMRSAEGLGGPTWVFGVPFFRKFYTSFRLDKDSRKTESIYVAEDHNGCQLGGGQGNKFASVVQPTAATLSVKLSDMRPPRWTWRRRPSDPTQEPAGL